VQELVREADPIKVYGRVDKGVGLVIEGLAPGPILGTYASSSLVTWQKMNSSKRVIGFKEDKILLMPLQEMRGIGRIEDHRAGRQKYVRVGDEILGRVIDGLGNPMDGKGHINGQLYPIYQEPIIPS